MSQASWIILTGEYPPQRGGVSDYTHQLARRLAEAGDEVEVYAPAFEGARDELSPVRVHRLADHYGLRGLRRLSRELNRRAGQRLLVQYVPHAYGYKAMNVLFARWLARQARRNPVWIQFHEVAYPYEPNQKMRHRLLAWTTHWMARRMAHQAQRIFITTPMWEPLLKAYIPQDQRMTWLPSPSNLPAEADSHQVRDIRAQWTHTEGYVGHFGTFGPMIMAQLQLVVPRILRNHPGAVLLLIGRGGEAAAQQFTRDHPALRGRIHATGGLAPDAAAAHIAACDVMIQPYPDGVTCRRGSVMAALALGRAVVTTDGPGTEAFWKDSDAIALAPVDRPERMAAEVKRLLESPELGMKMGQRAKELYITRFSMEHTVAVLRESAMSEVRP